MATVLTSVPAIWDSDAELATWTLDNVVVVDGTWQLAPGERVGTATSPALQLDDFLHVVLVALEDVSRPAGQDVYVRVRTAATEEGLAEASWSPYFGGVTSEGTLLAPLRTWVLNNSISEGAYWQIEVTLER